MVWKYSFPQKPTNKIELLGGIWLYQTAGSLKRLLIVTYTARRVYWPMAGRDDLNF